MYESRLFWLLAASFVAWLASFPFHRFDPAREWRLGRRPTSPESAASFTSTDQVLQPAHVAHFPARLSSLAREGKTNTNRSPFVRLVLAELRLMLKGQRWWWYVTALGLAIACLVSPLPASRGGVLLAAWLWPLLLWSAMGSRESRFSTQSLVFSSARSLPRQLPAVWFAGVLVAVLTGGGVAVRLLLGGNGSGLGAWIARALFIPSLALALGVWSGGSKMFEAIYTVWWYVGPAHHTPGLDFMGVSAASSRPLLYLTLTAVLLIASYWGRRSRLGYA
jgi:hypothetical protein